MSATIQLRPEQIEKIRSVAGLRADIDLAARMGVSRQSVFRTFTGRTRVTAEFIAALLTALSPFTFDDLFTVATDSAEDLPGAEHVDTDDRVVDLPTAANR